MASGEATALRGGEVFGTNRLDAGTFVDVMIEQLVELTCFRNVLFEEADVIFLAYFGQEHREGRLDTVVADWTQSAKVIVG
jgi:hypothetical protein